jgi:hypothetical protein
MRGQTGVAPIIFHPIFGRLLCKVKSRLQKNWGQFRLSPYSQSIIVLLAVVPVVGESLQMATEGGCVFLQDELAAGIANRIED